MSYILEALKRAEEQRGASPRAVPPPRALPDVQPSRARWPWIAGVVAGVISLAAVVFWTIAVPPTSPPVVAGAPPPVVVAPPPRAEPPARVEPGPRVEPAPRVRPVPRVEPRPQRPPEPTRPSAAVARQRPTPRQQAPAMAPPVPEPTRAAPPGPTAPEPVAPPSPAGDIKALTAKLSLQVLTWAPDPKDRFVFLSGRKYVEGQTIDDKLLVERITENSVVLSFQGQRVTLTSP